MRAVYFIVFMRKLFFLKPHVVSALHFWSPHEVTVPFIVLSCSFFLVWAYEGSISFQGPHDSRPYTFLRQQVFFIIIFMRSSFFKCIHEFTVPFIVLRRRCSFFLIWGQQFLSGASWGFIHEAAGLFTVFNEVQLLTVFSWGSSFFTVLIKHQFLSAAVPISSSSFQQQFLSSSSFQQQFLWAEVPISSSSYQLQFL